MDTAGSFLLLLIFAILIFGVPITNIRQPSADWFDILFDASSLLTEGSLPNNTDPPSFGTPQLIFEIVER